MRRCPIRSQACSPSYVSRFTFHVSRFTFHVLRFTFYVLRFTPSAASPRESWASRPSKPDSQASGQLRACHPLDRPRRSSQPRGVKLDAWPGVPRRKETCGKNIIETKRNIRAHGAVRRLRPPGRGLHQLGATAHRTRTPEGRRLACHSAVGTRRPRIPLPRRRRMAGRQPMPDSQGQPVWWRELYPRSFTVRLEA